MFLLLSLRDTNLHSLMRMSLSDPALRKRNGSEEAGNERNEHLLCHVCGGRRQLPLIAALLASVTRRRKVPPYWGGWLHRLPFCPVTDALYMCHSRGPVTLRRQSREDEMRRTNSGEESNKGATPDNAVSVFITTH